MLDPAENAIFVKSHVARDLLQNAALFKTDKLCVWEYVSNGLQYVDDGTSPIVHVTLDSKRKRVAVADNGRGMDWAGLRNFFVMHGENVDRREGRPGRGRFGTGKSAAFGIGDTLRITTVRKGRRSQVELTRAGIDEMRSEDPVPVRIVEREVPSVGENGTTIEIEGIHLRSLDQPGIIRYVERHLRHWRNASVFINNHECEFFEPPVSEEHRFLPEGSLKEALGDAELRLKVSKVPLGDDDRGVQICANGVLHETTLVGSEGREMAQYIFGDIDVPQLDEDSSPIPPFDLSRSMRLNPSNELVQAVYGFVGSKVEELRRKLIEIERKRRETQEAKKLEEDASQIERIINEDFNAWRHRLAKAKARAAGGADLHPSQQENGNDEDDLVFGALLPAEVVSPTGDVGPGKGTRKGGTQPPALGPQVLPASPDGDKKGSPAGGAGERQRPRGGFNVKFDSLGSESHRAVYVRDERTIYINLDHPQLTAAKGSNSIEDITFRQLAYEIAFSEYAVALASELNERDEYMDPSDPIVDIRETLNRIARRAASLYSR